MAITCYFSNTIIKLGAKSPPNEGKSVFKQYLNTHPQPLEWLTEREGGREKASAILLSNSRRIYSTVTEKGESSGDKNDYVGGC